MEASLQLHSHMFTPTHPHTNSLSSPFPRKPKRKPLPLILRCCSDETNTKKLVGFVDYDRGERQVSVHVSGVRKSDLPKRYQLRVQGDRFQKDWPISELVSKILKLNQREDIDGLLNRWTGRFSRKNYPILIRVS